MSKRLLILMCSIFLVIPLAFMGCGDDGSDGAQGPIGPQGPPGPAGDNATAADLTIQDLAKLGLVFSEDVQPINLSLDLSKTVAYNSATGALTIHFFLTDEDGAGIDITKNPYEFRVMASELIPASAGPAVNPGPAWTRLINESGTPALGSTTLGTLTLVDAATGEYNYVCKTPLPATSNVVRVTVRTRFRFRDNNNVYIAVANPVNASYDFLQSDPGTRLASSGADMVTTGACESCHGARIGDVGHGGGYTQYETCTHCHNANFMATEDPQFDLAFMIHRIHDKGVITTAERTFDFSEVTYPQPINNCAKCHNGPEAALAFTNPTRHNCNSCHEAVNFATGAGHVGGAQASDASCVFCHAEGGIGLGPIEAHNPPLPLANLPEFNVTMTLTPPSSGTFYSVGDNVLVTVTLTDNTGAAVPSAVYTTFGDNVSGVAGGNKLRVASLYVYGPRARALPVLTTASVTLNADGLYGQSNSLFLGTDNVNGPITNTDPQLRTDATGFKYQLLTIPDNVIAGTYMVRVRVSDYGRISDSNFRIESIAFATIQIGTATVEPKLSGDACVDCHGAGTAGFHDARHVVIWSADECLSCHDYSNNHADPLSNRVHAVHRATVTGDLADADWSHVTYPQPANNCLTCHTNANADTPVWRTPNMVACGGCHGAIPTADPATFPAAQQEQVIREVAAAQHMLTMGGTPDPRDTTQTLSCLVCHGEDRSFDLAIKHQILRFRPLPVDPNE
jgi:hypothetical protein